jgi:hypothetical protein
MTCFAKRSSELIKFKDEWSTISLVEFALSAHGEKRKPYY